jgi:hypothetical protein
MVTFLRLAILSALLLLTCFFVDLKAQCTGGTSAGSITPGAAWQTVCITGGNYRTFNATAGRTYTFSFCQGGGSATFDTEITIIDHSSGIAVPGAYNDDKCGTGSEYVFIAPATVSYRVYVTQYSCLTNATCQTLAYQTTVPSNDNICGATYIYSNACALNYTTYTTGLSTASPQANPGCANYVDRDVWYSTKVPSSGKLLITTNAGQITDGGMAVYKGSSCSSALTLLSCDDDSGPGNMPELNLTGLTPGDSLFIRFWAYNNAQSGTFSIALQDPAPYYCMSGQASEINSGSNCVQMTPNKQAQIGCMWNTTQINMSSAFDYTFSVNLGTNDGNGADGITFVMQNNPAGLSACGNSGYQLAAGPLSNTFIIEFDTFNNNNGTYTSDIPEDHIAIDVNGNMNAPVAGPVQASSSATNIEDGANHTVRITWNPGTTLFSVYFDGVFRLSYTNNIIASVFGGNPNVYWGFTSSTGLYTNTQSLCPGTLPGAPAPVTWGKFDVYMINQKVNLFWETHSEENTASFIVERSADGRNYTSIGNVDAKGNSKTSTNYQFEDFSPLAKTSYYRLKQLDINGEYTYSVVRVVNNGNQSADIYHLYPNPSSSAADINIELSEKATVQIYDNANTIIYQQNFLEGKSVFNLSDQHISPGMYYVMIQSDSGVYYTKLIFSN